MEDSDLKTLLFSSVVPRLRGPTFIYWLPKLEESRKTIEAYWSSTFRLKAGMLFASVKCNPCLPLLAKLSPSIDGFDISSLEEFRMLSSAGFAANRLTLSGPAKQDELLNLAIQTNVKAIHLDSLEEVAEVCSEPTSATKFTLRLSPDFFSIKQGMNELEADQAVANFQQRGLELHGLHIYMGREAFSADQLFIALDAANTFFKRHKNAFRQSELFLGPGFLGHSQKSRWPSIDPQEIASRTDAISKIHLEVGRGLFESCGFYFASVLSVKRSRNRPIVIIDGGNQHFAEKLVSESGADEPYLPLAADDGPCSKMLVAGSFCQDRDLLHPSCELPSTLKRGDWLLFPNRGAYGLTASNSQFIGQRPVGEWLGQMSSTNEIELIPASPQYFVGYHRAFFSQDRNP